MDEHGEQLGEKRIVVPGERVFDAPRPMPGAFVDNGKTYASVLSLLQGDRLVALKGRYVPVPGDVVLGVVTDERFSGYSVDLNSPFEGLLSTRETREEFHIGDVMSARIINVDEMHRATLSETRKVSGGELIEFESVKVPRVIGRNGSMLATIHDATGADVLVGKNGRAYLKGGDAALATLAILKICRESHVAGLTERIARFLADEASKRNGGTA